MAINDRIKTIRTTLELSQDEFAKTLGVTGAGISKIESGTRGLTDTMVKLICREFNVNYYYLTEGTGDMFVGLPETAIDEITIEYDLNDFERNMVIEFLKLKKEERAVLIKYIKSLNNK